jgi:hypothetical protein
MNLRASARRTRICRGNLSARLDLRRGESGVVIPLVAFSFAVLLVALALVLDTGLITVSRSQVQNVTDAAARAAMITIANEGSTLQGASLRDAATRAAISVARSTSVIQGGVSAEAPESANTAENPLGDLEITFGDYDFMKKEFFVPVGEDFPPRAVRVVARRAEGTPGGPIRRLIPRAGASATFDVQGESVAALRCRNVAILVDVSASFSEDIVAVGNALASTIDDLREPDNAGIVLFRNRVLDQSSDRLIPLDRARELQAIADLLTASPPVPGVSCPVDEVDFRGPSGSISLPACVGTDMAAAVQKAVALLSPGNGRNPACEDVVVLMTDGEPCPIPQELIDLGVVREPTDPNEPRGGGSTNEEALAARGEMREGCDGLRAATCASIAAVAINTAAATAAGQTCPVMLKPDSPDPALRDLFAAVSQSRFATVGNRIRVPESLGRSAPSGVRGNIFVVGTTVAPSFLFISTADDANIDREFLRSMTVGQGQFFLADLDEEDLRMQMTRALSTLPPALTK